MSDGSNLQQDDGRGSDAATSAKAVTLHGKILDDVRNNILSGAWAPGHRIPFETDMAAHYGCSRMTVNKVLTRLADAGFLERRRRGGTIVRQPRSQSAVLAINDIEREILDRGQGYSYGLLSRRLRLSTAGDEGRLGLRRPGKVLHLKCIHAADGEPFCVEERLINLGAVPSAAAQDFGAVAPGGWLLRQVPWSTAEHTISAVNADDELASLLRRPSGDACLVIDRKTTLAGVAVTRARLAYSGAKHQLVAQFTPNEA